METSEAQVGFKPLYSQVREEILRRLADGMWQPGAVLPSEQELARTLGVSQGTVRKSLDALTSEGILVRRQGRGTFVAEFEESRILFQFFRLAPDVGERYFPNSKVLDRSSGIATPVERVALALGPGAKVWRIERVRYFDKDPILTETISLPLARFPKLGQLKDIPNNVYQLYSREYGISIARSSERIKAVGANAHDARELGCPEGTPLLLIARTAFDFSDVPVEFRQSHCLTDKIHYASDLR